MVGTLRVKGGLAEHANRLLQSSAVYSEKPKIPGSILGYFEVNHADL